ncbi:MAG TPA: protein translocase subunit SecF [Usitatibacter sp.]|jgi:preprotein translocase subunit SecF|nr:protein translocase subunit SecF [Usitatibacter sp.]
MEFFRIRRTIPFMRHALVFNAISVVVFLASVVLLATRGLHFSIEFTGGTVMEVSYDHAADPDKVRDALLKIGLKDASVQNFGSSRDVLIRMGLPKVPEGANQNAEVQRQNDAVVKAIKAQDPGADVKRVDVVGGVVGKELATDGGLALLFVCIGIVIYLAFRFEWRFAVATIVANLHDVVIILGFFALFQWEFSLPVLAAVLAVFGYSVNESVVVFDRVRENFKKMRKASVDEVMDASITGTISRTIITHLCTQMMVLSIFFFGGASLHYFALALTVGILFGIYSSVLVACPLAKYLGASRADFVKPERKTVEPQVP